MRNPRAARGRSATAGASGRTPLSSKSAMIAYFDDGTQQVRPIRATQLRSSAAHALRAEAAVDARGGRYLHEAAAFDLVEVAVGLEQSAIDVQRHRGSACGQVGAAMRMA